MTCHWENKTIEFMDQGHKVKMVGHQTQPLTIHHMSLNTLHKWIKGNAVWAMVVVDTFPQSAPSPPSDQIQDLLSQYQDVFTDPKTLPPQRFHDHQIPLLPGTAPLNSRPYRYSPLHKTEIERQVKELLEAGLIVPSTSLFASLVLWQSRLN